MAGECWKLVLPSGLRRGLGTPAGSDPARGSTLQMSSLDPTSILLLLLKYAMLCPHLTRSERFPIPSWCFFIPRVLWRPAQLFSHLSALWLSRLGSLLPFSQWQLYQSIYFLNFLNIATGTGAIWYKYNELYHIAPVPNLLIFLHQLPSNCTLYCKKLNYHKCCKEALSIRCFGCISAKTS